MTEEKNEVIFDDDKISKSEEFVNPDELYQELIQCVQKYHPSDDISMIENVYVAGGIGSGINMANAINIGMFPDIPVEMYHYVGNTSLAGAYAMLCSTESERKVYDLAANMTYIELSTIPQYMDEFVGACFLPHTDASLFPNR